MTLTLDLHLCQWAHVDGDAFFSEDRQYRYWLTHRWAPGPASMFVSLNPSDADEHRDDQITRRDMDFADRFGYDAVTLLNLSAAIMTNPKGLAQVHDPIAVALALARLVLDLSANPRERWIAAGQFDWIMRRQTGIAKAPFVAGFVDLILQSEQPVMLLGWHHGVHDIWAERLRYYQPAVHKQAMGRPGRPGQTNPVRAYFCATDYGSDPVILETLDVKSMQAAGLITGSGDGGVAKATPQGIAPERYEQIRRLAAHLVEKIDQPTAARRTA